MKKNLLAKFSDDLANLEKGRILSRSKAEKLEKAIEADPKNIAARLKLIGFYRLKPEFSQTRTKHIVWMISNMPQRIAWRHRVMMALQQKQEPELFAMAVDAWLKQIEETPADANVVGNAGLFLIESDFNLGKQLLSQASDLSPLEDFWPGELSRFCFYHAQSVNGKQRHADFDDALRYGEMFLERYGYEGGRSTSAIRERALIRCSRARLILGKAEVVLRHAHEAIKLVENWNEKPKTGLSLLGLVAVQRGDVSRAQEYLLASNQSYLPDFADLELANELITKGSFECVSSYLRECQQLGIWPDRALEQWIEALNRRESITLI